MLYAEAPEMHMNAIKWHMFLEQDIARRKMQLANCKELIMKLQKILV
jgi:hypothetical protein